MERKVSIVVSCGSTYVDVRDKVLGMISCELYAWSLGLLVANKLYGLWEMIRD